MVGLKFVVATAWMKGEFNMQETDEENEFLKNAKYFYDVCKDEYERDKSVRYGMKQTEPKSLLEPENES